MNRYNQQQQRPCHKTTTTIVIIVILLSVLLSCYSHCQFSREDLTTNTQQTNNTSTTPTTTPTSTSTTGTTSTTSTTTDSNKRVINVRGEGKVSVKQTNADISISIESKKETATLAQQDVSQKATSIVQLLKTNNQYITKLETTSISLYPIYKPLPVNTNETLTIIGYQATTSLSFRVIIIEQIGKILDQLVQLGVGSISGLNLIANDTEINRAKREALRLATLDALDKAKVVLLATFEFKGINIEGMNINDKMEVLEMNVESSYAYTYPYRYRYNYATAAGGGAAPSAEASPTVPVVAGEDSISSSVTLKVKARD
ncbi:hypothetical protein ABK040_011247 [Willaertia magna]